MARGVLIGSAQILALLPGISCSGITMVAGLMRGSNHDDTARFSFLLPTPVILAAGVFKMPDLFGPLGQGIHGQVLVGSIASFASAYFAVRFLTRYFHTRTQAIRHVLHRRWCGEPRVVDRAVTRQVHRLMTGIRA